ncbi:MAG: hypothetical protein P4L36_00530 [Holophaga sp.]|nr:hypothetical protein [Holophaga sp.]
MSDTKETGRPAWYDPGKVVLELDVALLLAAGEHPLARVRLAVAACAPGDIVELRTGFRPEPLLEVFQAAGMDVWCGLEGSQFRTSIRKPL